MSETATYDLLVVGGGINGSAIARHAAGEGLSVLLAERDDLGSHTSSASTKLIHGGLRYLEMYDFKLVREALIEREVLLRAAPHIIWPMRFVLPYSKGLRPAWMLRAGLFLYDHLGGRELLPGTRKVRLDAPPFAGVLEDRLKFGFEYSDCWVEDSRLVALNAVDARARGAEVSTRTLVRELGVEDGRYTATLAIEDGPGKSMERRIRARAVVNSAGPWVEDVLQRLGGAPASNESELRLVKGSHIVTRRLYAGDHAYIFQNADGRVIFAIPYERDYTLIGTTDQPYTPAEGPPKISDAETAYLRAAASEYFAHPIAPDDVVWTYSGVRPLYDDRASDASSVTRDYVLDIDEPAPGAPILSVFGGKITTSRHLALDAMERLAPFLGTTIQNWTKTAPLPGGDLPDLDYDAYVGAMRARFPDLAPALLARLVRAYGTRVPAMLEGGTGEIFTPRLPESLTESEVAYLVDTEFVTRADDVLWRRSKMGLHMRPNEREAFHRAFAKRFG